MIKNKVGKYCLDAPEWWLNCIPTFVFIYILFHSIEVFAYRPKPLIPIKGLSQNEVRCIHQDKEGFLWIGTQDGLNRYDGYEFKKYAKSPFDKNSLSFDIINTIAENEDGNLWIGTYDGLDFFDKSSNKFFSYRHLLTEENNLATVTSVVPLSQNKLIISTLSHLYIFEKRSSDNSFTSKVIKHSFENIRIRKGFLVGKDQIYYSTNQGIISLNTKSTVLTSIKSTANFDCVDMCVDRNSNLWIINGKQIGIYRIGEDLFEQKDIEIDGISALYFDHKGKLWVGTKNNGLYQSQKPQIDIATFQLLPIYLIDNQDFSGIIIKNIYESDDLNEDIVWVGSENNGLLQYSRSKNSFVDLHQIISNQEPDVDAYYGLMVENGKLLAGVENGIISLDLTTNKVQKIITKEKSIEGSLMYCQEIYIDQKGDKWFGSKNGLFVERIGKSPVPFPIPSKVKRRKPVIFKLKEDKHGNLWVGTSDYLAKIKDEKVSVIDSITVDSQSVVLNSIGAIEFDNMGRMWLGTTTGLIVKNGDDFTKFTYVDDNENGLMEDIIHDILISKNGTVWIASSKGLSKVIEANNKITFKHFSESNGLLNTFVYGILEDKSSCLWICTNDGLYKFDPGTERFAFYNLSTERGSQEFNSGSYYKDITGDMYFGGLDILLKFNPEKIVSNLHIPKVKLTEIRVDDVVLNDSILGKVLKEQLRVFHSNKVISLKIAALDFTDPQKNQFAYRIRNIDSTWVQLRNQRMINLINLPYGLNEIEIKASNNEGIWGDNSITVLQIDVIPPFWRTWWFYLLIGLTAAAIIYGWYKMVLRNKLLIERTRLEENERVRKIASQDLHDEFGNSLTRITILTEQIKSKINQNKKEEVEVLLSKIADNSGRLYQGTKDFIWSIRADSDNLLEAMIRVKDFAEEVLSDQISFREFGLNETLKNKQLPKASSRHVVMILKEAISNTIKHACAKNASLSILLHEENRVTISWKDDGEGFVCTNEKGNGLGNMKSRAASIGALFDLESSIDLGTKISITIAIT